MRTIKVAVVLVLALTAAAPTGASAREKKISKKDVPTAVTAAFEKAYPGAKVRGYTTETEHGKTYYEVESMMGESSLDVTYLPDGTATEIEEGVPVKDLPESVVKTVKTKFPNGTIAKAERTTAGSSVTYELRIKTGKISKTVELDPSGKIITEPSGEED